MGVTWTYGSARHEGRQEKEAVAHLAAGVRDAGASRTAPSGGARARRRGRREDFERNATSQGAPGQDEKRSSQAPGCRRAGCGPAPSQEEASEPVTSEPQTKVCPRCGAELFGDMGICYECLYDFTRPRSAPPTLPEAAEPGVVAAGADEAEEAWDQETDADAFNEPSDATMRLEPGTYGDCTLDVLSLRIRSSDVDVTLPLGEDPLIVGRSPDCDVVLHSPAVSRRHVCLEPVGDGALVRDLGATNPAMLKGRSVRDGQRLVVGDTFDVCGTLFTLVGPTDSA